MADENKSRQDADQEALTPAETESPETDESLSVEITELTDEDSADTAENTVEDTADKTADAANAADEMDADEAAFFAELDRELGKDADSKDESEKAADSDAAPSKADVLKEKAAGFAGKLKEKA
ncbi:MAG: hypothetical protein J6S92_06075, partial [Oscillospiraceae bacterium]|nr:hypothetical protein [Oscillospiraceae bacterium]